MKAEQAAEWIDLVLKYGISGFLVIVIFLLVQKPDRAEKLKVLILVPLFRLFKWGSRQYLASKVGSATTEFFNSHVTRFIPSIPDVKVRIKWVSSASDPVLSEDGTVILRLEETNDQTRNILSAALVALPQVVCATLRSNIQQYAEAAIDLTILRKLAERLGRHAKPVFQRYFLEPEIESSQKTADLFGRLVEIDEQGIFVPIFLEELNILGETIYASADTNDKTESINAFLEFLLTVARREIGEEIDLNHFSEDFSVGIMLIAKTWKAATEGIVPFLTHIDVRLRKGCESIYVVAFPQSVAFVKRITSAVDAEQRLSVVGRTKVTAKSPDGDPHVREIIPGQSH